MAEESAISSTGAMLGRRLPPPTTVLRGGRQLAGVFGGVRVLQIDGHCSWNHEVVMSMLFMYRYH